MSISQLIPFRKYEYNGILQAMLKANHRKMFTFKVTSTTTEARRTAEEVLNINESYYFATLPSQSLVKNYFQNNFILYFQNKFSYYICV